jgi:WD40 repeat protein
MPRAVAIIVAMVCCVSSVVAQEKLPPRFEPLAKNDRFRLLRVLGMPELRPTFAQTSAISGDGKWAIYAEDLSTGDDEKPHLRTRLLLYDLQAKSWPREFEIDGRAITALDLSHDGGKAILAGQFIAEAPKEKKRAVTRACLILFDLRAGKAIRTIETLDDYFQCVALAPDESAALTGSDNTLKHWGMKQKAGMVITVAKNAAVAAVAYLPGGKDFLASDTKGEIRLWNIGQVNPVRTFGTAIVNQVGVWRLAVSRDGTRFAATNAQNGVTLWEIATGKEIAELWRKRFNEEFIAGLALSDDAKTAFTVAGKFNNPGPSDFGAAELIARDVESKKTLWSAPAPYRSLVPIHVKDGNLLIGGGANLFETWSIKDGKKLDSWGGHKGPINAVAVLPDGDILSAGQDGDVLTWHAGQVTRKQAAINVLAQSSDRKHWLSAGGDPTITLHAVGAEKPLHLLKGHTGPITSIAFSNANWAASGSGDRTAKTWDLTAGKEIAVFAGHSECVNAVAVSPDDKWLATGSDDATIKLWPIKAGKLDPDREAIALEGHKKAITCLAFSPDGKTLISGSQDQTLKVWDWAKEKAIRTIPGHKNWISSLLLVDAKTALTTSDDLTLRWWDLESGKEIGRLDFGVIGDCPRCLARLGEDRLLVGTSSWLIYELQMLPADKSGKRAASSN